MTYVYPEIKNFLGLHLQANSFTVPDGSMEVANNLVVKSDNVAAKIRGNYLYFDTSSDIRNLFFYNNTLLAAFADKISYFTDTGSSPNLTGVEHVLSGVTVDISPPRVSRSAEQSRNLYFTADDGILKLEDFDSSVYKAGTPPALDLAASLLPENGPLQGGYIVGYRVVFGRRDSNDNLILGSPSDVAVISNPFGVVGVSYTSAGVGPYTVTVTSPDHGLTTGMSITVTNATDPDANGSYVITSTGANTFTYSTTNDPTTGTLDYGAYVAIRLEFSVPSEITTTVDGYFYQLYRSSQVVNTGTPPGDFKLVTEEVLSATEIANHVVFYDDFVDDILVQSAEQLYTNENSREGELQANAKPPLAEDIALYKDYLFFANTTQRATLGLTVVSVDDLVNGSYIEIKVGATTRRYVALTGVGNFTVDAETVTSGGGDILIGYTAHGFSNGYTVYIDNVVGGTLTPGTYFVVSAAANSFKISLTSGGAAIAYNGETALTFEGVTNGTNPVFYFSQGASFSVNVRDTAKAIVKAVNRDSLSLVYAHYTSGLDEQPGQMVFSAKGFGDPIYIRADSAAVGSDFSPTLPDSFASGTQVFSRGEQGQNVLYFSKVAEPEAVPLVNFVLAGARNKDILRIKALRDSIIIVKEDGLFRLTGDDPGSFAVTALDTTVICVAASTVAILNNNVMLLSNQGVCLVSETAVQIISRRIDDVIQPILGYPNLGTQGSAYAYESERLYFLSVPQPSSSAVDVTWIYNILNDTWTQSDVYLAEQGIVGPADTLYFVNLTGDIQKERKNQTRVDFCGQNYATTVVSVASNGLSATITSTAHIPNEGDVLLKSDVFSRIQTVTNAGLNTYTVTFPRMTNLIAADTPTLYARYISTLKMAPFHAGLVGRFKQFAQLQMHFRDANISRAFISFTGYTVGGSAITDWSLATVAGGSEGWGFEPWGFFPWGDQDGINITQGTKPQVPIRIYIPLFQQRTTFIQTLIEHKEAGESINLQALAFAMRAYQERVSV